MKKKYTKADMEEYAEKMLFKNAGEIMQKIQSAIPPVVRDIVEIVEKYEGSPHMVLVLDMDEMKSMYEIAYEYLQNPNNDEGAQLALMKEFIAIYEKNTEPVPQLELRIFLNGEVWFNDHPDLPDFPYITYNPDMSVKEITDFVGRDLIIPVMKRVFDKS